MNVIHHLMLIGTLLVGQAATAGDEGLNIVVRRLVRQLDSPQLAQREAAEAELLRHGPAVLDLLPPANERAPAEVKQRLGRVRQKLEQVASDAVTKASTITLHAKEMPLSKILEAFQTQSDNTIVDYRRQFGQPVSDPTLTVDFDQTPFWPALDQLLDQAGLTIYPYAEQRAINVVSALGEKRADHASRISYSGPFRFEAIAVVARRDLREPNGRALLVTLEAAWEPRLRVISLLNPMADVRAVDERGDPLPVAQSDARPEVPTSGEASAVNLDLPLRLPSRDVKQISSLKGKLLATVPGRIETFRFDKLADAKNVEQRIAGVTVTLERVQKAATGGRATDASWEVRIRVRFDDAGDALASHRQWVFDNQAYLEAADGKPIAHDSFETTAQGKNELGVAYLFTTDRPLSELTFVYKTPGSIVTRGFDYELKDIELP
jgi:hypothetical protein